MINMTIRSRPTRLLSKPNRQMSVEGCIVAALGFVVYPKGLLLSIAKCDFVRDSAINAHRRAVRAMLPRKTIPSITTPHRPSPHAFLPSQEARERRSGDRKKENLEY